VEERCSTSCLSEVSNVLAMDHHSSWPFTRNLLRSLDPRVKVTFNMACQSQFSEQSNAHGPSADKLPALDAACVPPALVESTAKRQRFQLDECDPLKARYAESVTLAALRRDEPHMRDVFNRHKDLDNGLSKAAFISALREVAAPVLFSRDEDGVYKLADTNMSDSVDFSEFGRPFFQNLFPQTFFFLLFSSPAISRSHNAINALIFRFMFSANFSDELEKLLQRHNLSVRLHALAPRIETPHSSPVLFSNVV
jgi:hypothetical protein